MTSIRPAFLVTIPVFWSAVILAACAEEPPETPPRQLSASPFQYPEQLWDAGLEGETMLRIRVAASGEVDSVQVQQSSGYAAFDSSATAGARELRFDPARRGEEAVETWVLLPVQFDMKTPGSAAPEPQ